MANLETYKNVFIEVFSLSEDFDVENLQFKQIPEWDSVGHMDLVASLEDAFDVMLETDEIIGLDSFNKGLEVLKAHDVEF
ncbi:MAG: acyl carrier protein [Lachnospiraceae bacterium]|nr:acyl carrier protein [Lachnospiraceae bacterium]